MKRHPNDLKCYDGEFPEIYNPGNSEDELLRAWREVFESIDDMNEPYADNGYEVPDQPAVLPVVRRSQRIAAPNPRYYNDDFVTE